MNGVMWMQVVMAMVFVGARMYTRHFIIHNIGWDDTFMIVNLVSVALRALSLTIQKVHFADGLFR
jgi:hypothetical protein